MSTDEPTEGEVPDWVKELGAAVATCFREAGAVSVGAFCDDEGYWHVEVSPATLLLGGVQLEPRHPVVDLAAVLGLLDAHPSEALYSSDEVSLEGVVKGMSVTIDIRLFAPEGAVPVGAVSKSDLEGLKAVLADGKGLN